MGNISGAVDVLKKKYQQFIIINIPSGVSSCFGFNSVRPIYVRYIEGKSEGWSDMEYYYYHKEHLSSGFVIIEYKELLQDNEIIFKTIKRSFKRL